MRVDRAAGRPGRPRQPLEEIPQEYAAFKIEQRGIDLIPDAERKMTPAGRQYDSLSLRSARDGLYWRNGGIHWPAVIPQGVGMVAALMWINAGTAFPAYVGPLSNPFPGLAGGDISSAIGIGVAYLLYCALSGRSVRRRRRTRRPPTP